MTPHNPILVVSGYASIDYALQLAPFEGHDATTIVRSRADEWPRYGGVAHVTRAAAAAAAAAAVDAQVVALSWVGPDAEGDRWVSAVEDGGATSDGVARTGTRSPSSHLLYPEGGGTICLFDPGDCHTPELTQAQQELLQRADLAVVTIGPADATGELLTAIPEQCRLFWIVKQDPASLPESLAAALAARASIVTLSDGERGYLDTIARVAEPGTSVIVTLGSQGSEVLQLSADRAFAEIGRVPATPIRGVDTTGAGDTFSGTLAALIAGDTQMTSHQLLDHVREATLATARMLAARSD